MAKQSNSDGRTRTIHRILRSASRVFGRRGYDGTSLKGVAREAGVPASVVQAHFPSKEALLIEAQRNVFRELNQRFIERAHRGERGLDSSLEALDSLWESVRSLRSGAPFVVQTLALANQEGNLGERVNAFCVESTSLLEQGISEVFREEIDTLAVSPARMAVVIRVLLEGLVVELARAHTPEQLAQVDQAYADMRELYERFALSGGQLSPAQDPLTLEPFPLPW